MSTDLIDLIVLGPGELPEAGAALGKAIRGFRDAASGIDETPSAAPSVTPPAGRSSADEGQITGPPIPHRLRQRRLRLAQRGPRCCFLGPPAVWSVGAGPGDSLGLPSRFRPQAARPEWPEIVVRYEQEI